MVLPRWLAQVNRRFTNRVLGRIPDRISPFVTLHHVGRHTGNRYAVLLAGFWVPGGILLPPTYGLDADWVRNLLAAESFSVERRGENIPFRTPRLVDRSVAWSYLPAAVRLAMRVLDVRWFVMADRD